MPDAKPPKPQSLKRYGITQEKWLEIFKSQGCICPICGKFPESNKWATDHEHVRSFKKMSPASRAGFVRGICCVRCNLMYLPVGITVEKAKNIVKYLEKYAESRHEIDLKSMPASVLNNKE